MKPSRLTLGLAGALVLALLVAWWRFGDRIDFESGMSDAPCNAQRLPVSGEVRDDWGQLCAFRADNALLIEKKEFPEVVMIGDSITAHWPLPKVGFANRGIPGQVSGQVMLRFTQDAIALRPKVIHIMVGTNDISGLRGPESPDMLENNIRAMVKLAKANDIPVIVGTVGPARNVPWRPFLDQRKWGRQINRWLAQMAREEAIVLANYYEVLALEDGSNRSELFADHSHPNAKGYAAMDRVLHAALDRAKSADESAN